MGVIKDIKEIKVQTKNANEKLDLMTNETFNKARKYDEIMGYINDIKFNVDKIALFVCDDGSVGVKIDYKLPTIKLFFDGDGKIIKNNRLYAINKLNLISLDEMSKISSKIEEAEKKNKNWS